jgi:N-methylhydantoinase B
MQGGCGGRPTKDGIDGVNFSAGSLRNVPTESIELEAPILVNRYMLADRVAAGKYRGGAPVTFEFQCLTPDAIVTARGMDRFRLRPYGRMGGAPGETGKALRDPGSAAETDIGKIDVLKLQPGDTVRITSPGGGGYGSPLDRDAALVARDVEEGFVTPAEARDVYGVVLDDGGRVDQAATQDRRNELRRGRSEEAFVFGDERAAYERRLPAPIQDLVAELLTAYPVASRQFLRDRLYARIEADATLSSQPTGSLIEELKGLLNALVMHPPRIPANVQR